MPLPPLPCSKSRGNSRGVNLQTWLSDRIAEAVRLHIVNIPRACDTVPRGAHWPKATRGGGLAGHAHLKILRAKIAVITRSHTNVPTRPMKTRATTCHRKSSCAEEGPGTTPVSMEWRNAAARQDIVLAKREATRAPTEHVERQLQCGVEVAMRSALQESRRNG